MKTQTFALDRVLAEIIQTSTFSIFTITQLRTEYQRVMRPSSPSPTEIRRYVYKQVGRLVRLGWVAKVGERMSRNIQYRVKDLPKGVTLDLKEPVFRRVEISLPMEAPLNETAVSSVSPTASSLHEIEANLNEVRMQFIATLGEAETYKSILAQHPCLREKLESTYHKSRDKSSNLMGQVRALEQTVKILVEQQ